ncbi:MAG: cation transporter [Planctomycetes bacterium]|nr:cation transporter [Planctomycetota bacterium]
MITRTAFDIDCNPIIPECGFACPKCIQEIQTTLASKDGVSEVSMGEGAQEGKIIVEHDPDIATVDQLIEALKILPSFYEGFFIPTMITS